MKKSIKFLSFIFLISTLFFSAGLKSDAHFIVPSGTDIYLDFENAVDFAANNNYFMVATANKIYVYNRQDGETTVVNITFTVKKIELNSYGIYILDEEATVYFSNFEQINFNKLTDITTADITANDFIVNDSMIIRMFENHIRRHAIIDGEIQSGIREDGDGDRYSNLKKIAFIGNSNDFKLSPDSELIGLASDGENLYTLKASGFYKNEILISGGNYKSIKYFGGEIFLLLNSKVITYNAESGAFTDFEISSASSKDGRLSGANDVFGYNNLLFVADTGNKRVSVFDKSSGDFIEHYKDFDGYPKFVAAAGGKLIIVTDSNRNLNGESLVYLIDLNTRENTPQQPIYQANAEIISTAASAGDFYLLIKNSDNSPMMLITINSVSLSVKISYFDRTITPLKIACGFGGDLFVLYDSGEVCKYDYENLGENIQLNAAVYNINDAEEIIKIGIDFEESLYALSTSGLLKIDLDNNQTAYTVASAYEREQLKSFAVLLSEDSGYILYTNTLVKRDDLDIGSFSNIKKSEDFKLLHEDSNYSLDSPSVLNINKGTAVFLFSYQNLINSDEDFFPISQYEELQIDCLAVIIAETDDYYIISYNTASLNAGLVIKDGALAVKTQLSSQKIFDGYMLSSTPLFYYPSASGYLSASDTAAELFESAAVFELDEPLLNYYYIELNGGFCGYVPKTFVSSELTSSVTSETFSYKRVVGQNIMLYASADLTGKVVKIDSGSIVKLFSVSGGAALIEIEIGGELFTGYIDGTFIEVKGKNAVRNSLIIALLALSFTITSFYFLSRKKSNII